MDNLYCAQHKKGMEQQMHRFAGLSDHIELHGG
jgi:hypothetical protein